MHLVSNIIALNNVFFQTVLVVVLLASVTAISDAQCHVVLEQCMSEDVEYTDGQKWTTSDCYECSCSSTGSWETLVNVFLTLSPSTEEPVLYKNYNFTGNRRTTHHAVMINDFSFPMPRI